MSVTSAKFKNDNTAIQVGGLHTTDAQTVAASTATTAYTSDRVVEVGDVDGAGAWFSIDDDGGSITPAVNTGKFVNGGTVTRPFILKAGKIIIATATVNVVPIDIEE